MALVLHRLYLENLLSVERVRYMGLHAWLPYRMSSDLSYIAQTCLTFHLQHMYLNSLSSVRRMYT